MPTVEELGRRAKQKYPGAYDHVPDADLGRKIQDTYPGAYDVIGTPATQSRAAAETPGAWERFFGSFGEQINVPGGVWSGIQEYFGHRPDQWKAVSEVLGTKRGSPEEKLALERAMKVPLSDPNAIPAPPTLEHVYGGASQMGRGDVAGGLGTLAGGTAANVGIDLLGDTSFRIPGTQSLNPKEQAALRYLQDEGILVPGGTLTGNLFWKGLQKLAEVTPIGAYLQQKGKPGLEQGLERVGSKLASEAHPSAYTPLTAGESVDTALTKKSRLMRDTIEEAYQPAHDFEANPANIRSVPVGKNDKGQPIMAKVKAPVDIRSLKAMLRPVYDDMRFDLQPSARYASAGFTAMESLLDSPDYIPLMRAERGLSGLKELAREMEGRSGGLAKMIIPELQVLIDQKLRSADPGVLASLQQGRKLHAQKMDTDLTIRKLRGTPDEQFAEDKGVYDRLVQSKDAAVTKLRVLAKEAPDEIPKLARATVEDALSIPASEGGFPKRADAAFGRWDRLGDETKKILYPNPLLRENLDKFFLGAKRIAENPNPSGTAVLGWLAAQGGWILNDPLTGVAAQLGGAGLAGLLFTPRGTKLLTSAIKPIPNKAAASALYGAIMAEMRKQRPMVSAEDTMPAPSGVSDEEKIRRQMGGRPMLPVTR